MSRLLAKTEALNTWVYYRDGKEIARIEIMEEDNVSISTDLTWFRRKDDFMADFDKSLIVEKKMKNLKLD